MAEPKQELSNEISDKHIDNLTSDCIEKPEAIYADVKNEILQKVLNEYSNNEIYEKIHSGCKEIISESVEETNNQNDIINYVHSKLLLAYENRYKIMENIRKNTLYTVKLKWVDDMEKDKLVKYMVIFILGLLFSNLILLSNLNRTNSELTETKYQFKTLFNEHHESIHQLYKVNFKNLAESCEPRTDFRTYPTTVPKQFKKRDNVIILPPPPE